jgi:deoxyribonuclease-4
MLGRDFDETAKLIELAGGGERLGLCLDSCHLFVQGFDIRDEARLGVVLDEADQKVGLERLRCLHVNDSKAPLGSNLDRHENIGDGLLGEQLGVFLGHPKLQGLPALLEVPGTDGHGADTEQMAKLRALHKKATKRSGRTRA